MAKKRVEENEEIGQIAMDEIMQEEPMQPIVKTPVVKEEKEMPAVTSSLSEPINCLRNERVFVKFIPRPTSMVTDPRHILYGGMAESATRSFVVPRINSTGLFVNVLTNNEKNFLEKAMGLEYNALSIYKRSDNFWDDSNPNGIGRVTLHKQGDFLDLSSPEDYIKYKILLANKDYIAPSIQELEERPKATYQFVIVSENAEAQSNLNKMDATMKCYMEYGKIDTDVDTMRTIIEQLEGRPLAPQVKLDYLQGKINEHIQRNPRLFLSVIKDELLPAKVLIRKALEAGIIGKKNDTYYLTQDGSPLCEINEESTFDVAAKYISSIRHQELKYSIEARLKEKN